MEYKKTYKVYKPKDSIYVIEEYIIGDNKYYNVEQVMITSVDIGVDTKSSKEIISYWVKSIDGVDWGDSIPEEYVNHDPKVLLNKLKEKWGLK